MRIVEQGKIYLVKLQGLPDNKKKIVLWTIVVVLAVAMGTFWIMATADKFEKIGESVQKIEIPELDMSIN